MAEKNCIRCGKCCDTFPMSLEQIQRIEKYLQNNPDVLENLRNTSEIIDPPRRVCPFLRGKTGDTYCAIYPVRPEVCQVFAVKGVGVGLNCPEGTEITTISPESARKLLEVYTKPNGKFFKNMREYFLALIKGE